LESSSGFCYITALEFSTCSEYLAAAFFFACSHHSSVAAAKFSVTYSHYIPVAASKSFSACTQYITAAPSATVTKDLFTGFFSSS
jgi:hypothetical protein